VSLLVTGLRNTGYLVFFRPFTLHYVQTLSRAIKTAVSLLPVYVATVAHAQVPVVPGLQMPLPTVQLTGAPINDPPTLVLTNAALGSRNQYKETYQYCDGSIVTVMHRFHQNQQGLSYPPHLQLQNARPSTLNPVAAVSPVGYPNTGSSGPKYSLRKEAERWIVKTQPSLTSPNNPSPVPANWNITDAYREVSVWTPLQPLVCNAPPVATNTLVISKVKTTVNGPFSFNVECSGQGPSGPVIWKPTPNPVSIAYTAGQSAAASVSVAGVPVGYSCRVLELVSTTYFTVPTVTPSGGVNGATTTESSGYVFTTSAIPAPGLVLPTLVWQNNINPVAATTSDLTLYKTTDKTGPVTFTISCQYPSGVAWAPTPNPVVLQAVAGQTVSQVIQGIPNTVTCKMNEALSATDWKVPTMVANNVNASVMTANAAGTHFGMSFGPLSASNAAAPKSITIGNSSKVASTAKPLFIDLGGNIVPGSYLFTLNCPGFAPQTLTFVIPAAPPGVISFIRPAGATTCGLQITPPVIAGRTWTGATILSINTPATPMVNFTANVDINTSGVAVTLTLVP
jgi:Domain of unknown function (DUF5979)